MVLNGIEIDPARNPGTLDTITWDPEAAVRLILQNQDDLKAIQQVIMSSGSVEEFRKQLAQVKTKGIEFFSESVSLFDDIGYMLVGLPDGQRVFLSASVYGNKPVMVTIGEVALGMVKAYISPVNLETVSIFVTGIAPQFGPKAAGSASRMGIGNRQTVTVWPGIFVAMREVGGPSEIVQNSAYRELAPMDFIMSPPSQEAAYLPGHGSLNIGHTGSSIQGLWLYGVVSAIEHGFTEPYGADLDHIPVKSSDAAGIENAKRLINLGRNYTFFTLDTSYLFNLDAEDMGERYGAAIDAAVVMFNHIKSLKVNEPFDFEFSLDEGPAINTPEEQEYVLRELTKRGVSVQFIAPNVGFEKRVDYRLPDGLPALEARVKALSEIAAKYGALLDFHSGSDKSSQTYQTISRACGGNLKLKVSGKLQLILSEVLADLDPEFFNFWWDWTLRTTQAEAKGGSEVAAKYAKLVEERRAAEGANFKRSPKDLFFTDFSFSMVGAKDEIGRFLYRERFYSLKPEVQAEYTRRVKEYVIKLAEDLNLRR